MQISEIVGSLLIYEQRKTFSLSLQPRLPEIRHVPVNAHVRNAMISFMIGPFSAHAVPGQTARGSAVKYGTYCVPYWFRTRDPSII